MFDTYIQVHLDINRAADELRLSDDQRAMLSERFENPEFSERELGESLGWDAQRTARTAQSLRADRRDGAALRQFLADYKKLAVKSPLRLNNGNRAKTNGSRNVLSRLRTMFKHEETEEQIEADLRRRLRLAQLGSERFKGDS